MHMFKAKNGTVFHYNPDLSGSTVLSGGTNVMANWETHVNGEDLREFILHVTNMRENDKISDSLVQYGWTVTKIKQIRNGFVLCEGGSVDRASYLISDFGNKDSVREGDVFSVDLQAHPEFGFGKIDQAVLLYRMNH